MSIDPPMTEEKYLVLLRHAERNPQFGKAVKDLIMDEKAMAPNAPFRMALAQYFEHRVPGGRRGRPR